MGLRTLFAMVIAFAVVFAPALSRAGEALAAPPDHHIAMMDDDGHCQPTLPDSDEHDKSAETSCVSLCMGVAVPPAIPARSAGVISAPAESAIPALHLSYLGEIATPPPKFA